MILQYFAVHYRYASGLWFGSNFTSYFGSGSFIFVIKSNFLRWKWCLYYCFFLPRVPILNANFGCTDPDLLRSLRSRILLVSSSRIRILIVKSFGFGRIWIPAPDPQHCSLRFWIKRYNTRIWKMTQKIVCTFVQFLFALKGLDNGLGRYIYHVHYRTYILYAHLK